jgi:hypothetical protein
MGDFGMYRVRAVLVLFGMAVLAACSTPYQSSGLTGGFDEKELEPGIWRLSFGGNGYTTAETVQTYWLYRASQLAIEKGYDGFELLSNVQLVGTESEGIQLAASVPIFIPIYSGGISNKPILAADVRLLKRPFEPKPPKVFDAATLKASLDPLVNGKKCDLGNVCAHVHRYLFSNQEPGGQTAPPAADQPPPAPPKT